MSAEFQEKVMKQGVIGYFKKTLAASWLHEASASTGKVLKVFIFAKLPSET